MASPSSGLLIANNFLQVASFADLKGKFGELRTQSLTRLTNKDKTIETLREEVQTANTQLASTTEQLAELTRTVATLTEANPSSDVSRALTGAEVAGIPDPEKPQPQLEAALARAAELEAEKAELTNKLESTKKDAEV